MLAWSRIIHCTRDEYNYVLSIADLIFDLRLVNIEREMRYFQIQFFVLASRTETDFVCCIHPRVQTWTGGASLDQNKKPIATISLSAVFYSWIFQSVTKGFLYTWMIFDMCVSSKMKARAEFSVEKPWRTQRRVCALVCIFTCVICKYR